MIVRRRKWNGLMARIRPAALPLSRSACGRDLKGGTLPTSGTRAKQRASIPALWRESRAMTLGVGTGCLFRSKFGRRALAGRERRRESVAGPEHGVSLDPEHREPLAARWCPGCSMHPARASRSVANGQRGCWRDYSAVLFPVSRDKKTADPFRDRR